MARWTGRTRIVDRRAGEDTAAEGLPLKYDVGVSDVAGGLQALPDGTQFNYRRFSEGQERTNEIQIIRPGREKNASIKIRCPD